MTFVLSLVTGLQLVSDRVLIPVDLWSDDIDI